MKGAVAYFELYSLQRTGRLEGLSLESVRQLVRVAYPDQHNSDIEKIALAWKSRKQETLDYLVGERRYEIEDALLHNPATTGEQATMILNVSPSILSRANAASRPDVEKESLNKATGEDQHILVAFEALANPESSGKAVIDATESNDPRRKAAIERKLKSMLEK